MKVGIAWCLVIFTPAMAGRPRQQQCHKHMHKDPSGGMSVANLISATAVLQKSQLVKKDQTGGKPRIFGEHHQNPAINQLLQDYNNFEKLFNKGLPKKVKSQALQPLQGDVGPDPIYVDPTIGSMQSMTESQMDTIITGIQQFENCVKQLVDECGFLEEAARKVLEPAQNQDDTVDLDKLAVAYGEIKEILKDVDLISVSGESVHLEPKYEPIVHQEVSFQVMKNKYPQAEGFLRTVIFKAQPEELPSLFFSSMIG